MILNSFPAAPPPTPLPATTFPEDKAGIGKFSDTKCTDSCLTGYCYYSSSTPVTFCEDKKSSSQPWLVVTEVVQLVQLSVTASALAIYYIIYCYMQLIYYTLRSAIYFHNADGPMKITIGVVTLTSLVVGFNILVRLERIIGILF
ncbi:unnamed protein product [Arctia plantaginis]|uniref:Uncharacterized protein n=1 Tax=Arctia plantaginis TaxID=874455 RepID=A0A8S1BBT9_ARCPL|nr:unnamed protein product [Arctia plantaginis]CAB3255789.1 unnamed protein product [Arctia plantaginis]